MLIINKDNFDLNGKIEIFDENKNIKYWSQYDFSYKRRVHIYDEFNNEIGYVQYKILTTQDSNEVFDYQDNPIDISNFVIKDKKDNNYDIYHENNKVGSVTEEKDSINIEILNDSLINNCILFVFYNFE